MSDEKTLDRIRKLLAMAADTSSPNEAAIAAGRARKLMDMHQLTEWDLKTSAPSDFGTAKQPTMPEKWYGMLGIAMAWLNDVNARTTYKGPVPLMTFSGYLVDAVTAKELFLYLIAQAETQAKKVQGRKQDFKQGFAVGIQHQVRTILKEREQLKTSNGTALVVSKRALVTEKFGAMQTTTIKGKNSANYDKGFAVGKKIGLNRQVGEEKKAQLTNQ